MLLKLSRMNCIAGHGQTLWSITVARLAVSSLGVMGTDTDGGHFGSQKRGVSVFDDQGTEQRED